MRALVFLAWASAIVAGATAAAPAGRRPSTAFVPALHQPGQCWSGLACRKAVTQAPAAAARKATRREAPVMRLSPRSEEVPISDRVLSCIPYLLPIADGINYGRFLAFYFPQVAAPVYSFLGPFLAVYKSSPFASLAIYLALIYVGRTNAVSRFVRFNIQQSVVLDVALILPSLIFAILKDAPLYVQEPLTNTVFFALVSSILYVTVSLAFGDKPNQIPVISEAAEMAVGPF